MSASDLPPEDAAGGPAEAPAAGGGETPSTAGLGGPLTSEPPPEAGEPEAPAEVENDVSAVTAQRDEYLDALRRLQADFENYRKRVIKQQGDQMARAAEDLVGKLLPVLDTVDLALAHAVADPVARAGGPPAGPHQGGALAQVAGALSEALTKEGLDRIDPVGQPFDPTEHDAVMHEPGGEGGAGGGGGVPEVTEVLRAGYRWRGRVLRPAMVKVKG